MMRKDVSGGQKSNFKNRKNDEKRRFRRSKFIKTEKMIRKDVSGGGEAQVQKIRKKDEKRRFRRSKFKKFEKMMRKDVSGG
jgi:hypothetical protein